MVINDFHVCRTIAAPEEANSILIVDPDTMLPLSIFDQRFQLIAWWNTQFIQALH